jgi:hypothetical protein
MKDQQFNRLKTESTNRYTHFDVLSSGAIVKFFERQSGNNSSYYYLEGRVITEALHNGLAFAKLVIPHQNVIASGILLHPEEDNRELEEVGVEADTQE